MNIERNICKKYLFYTWIHTRKEKRKRKRKGDVIINRRKGPNIAQTWHDDSPLFFAYLILINLINVIFSNFEIGVGLTTLVGTQSLHQRAI